MKFLALALLAGCATVEGEKRISMGCLDPLSAECDDPTAVRPLTAQLPTKRTFGISEPMQEEAQPPPPEPDTPASRLLKKLGK